MSRLGFMNGGSSLARYYDRKFVEKTLALDDSLVKEYFPVSVVVGSILDIYQDLLSVSFQPIQGETWHPGANKSFSFTRIAGSLLSYRCPTVCGMGERCDERNGLYRVLLPRSIP